MKKHAFVTVVASLLAFTSIQAQDSANLFPEGDLESPINLVNPYPNPPKSQMQQGDFYIEPGNYESKGCTVSVETEEGSTFLRFMAPQGFNAILRTYIALDLPTPTPAALTISLRWRASDIAAPEGAPDWASVQCDPVFVMSDGSEKTIHGTLHLKESTGGEWVEVEKTVTVPEGAVRLVLQPGLYCVTGTLDVDDIKIFAE